MVALADADGKRQVTGAQPRMAEALDEILRPAEPTAQEPEQLVARAVQARRMQGTQLAVGRLQIHQVVEAVHELAHAGLAADPFEGGSRALGGGRR